MVVTDVDFLTPSRRLRKRAEYLARQVRRSAHSWMPIGDNADVSDYKDMRDRIETGLQWAHNSILRRKQRAATIKFCLSVCGASVIGYLCLQLTGLALGVSTVLVISHARQLRYGIKLDEEDCSNARDLAYDNYDRAASDYEKSIGKIKW